VVGALSARGYTKYTDQEFVRGGQLVTERDLPIGVNPSNTDIAGTIVANGKGGQRTTDISGAYDVGTGPSIGFSHTQGLDPQAREEMTPTLRKNGGGQAVAFSHYSSDASPGDVSPTMRSGTNVSGHAVQHGATVRRLTPMECERLMGWPDGWTDIPWNKKDHAPDSRRYAACGNGVVAPVAYWIGSRLAEVLK
jgi:DNA (cytosine-5)-methyltransferase 1